MDAESHTSLVGLAQCILVEEAEPSISAVAVEQEPPEVAVDSTPPAVVGRGPPEAVAGRCMLVVAAPPRRRLAVKGQGTAGEAVHRRT